MRFGLPCLGAMLRPRYSEGKIAQGARFVNGLLTVYFDYIEAQMNNANFNLDGVFQELKNLSDASLLLVSERIESIPSYNHSEGNNKCLQFFYSLEVPEPTTEKGDRLNHYLTVYKKLGLLRFVKKNSSIAKLL